MALRLRLSLRRKRSRLNTTQRQVGKSATPRPILHRRRARRCGPGLDSRDKSPERLLLCARKRWPLKTRRAGVHCSSQPMCWASAEGQSMLSGGRFFMKPIQIPSDGGKEINVLGIPMVIRIHGRDTGGAVAVVESHDVPGGGPPPHIHHREDETFQVLEGEYEWTVGAETFVARKGATIFAPKGVAHTYSYLGQMPGRLMCVITA